VKKIAAYFSQVGGANALMPLIGKLTDRYEVSVFGRQAVMDKLKNGYSLIREAHADSSSRAALEWLDAVRPDVLVTDTINLRRVEDGGMCIELWGRARKYGIPSIAYVDSWWAYDERFRLPGESGFENVPYRIATVDTHAQDALIDLGYPRERLIVTGSPRFQMLTERSCAFDADMRRRFCASKRVAKDDRLIIFVSQPIEQVLGSQEEWGFSEKSILEAVLATIQRLPETERRHIVLAVLSHPEEDERQLAAHLDRFAGGVRTFMIDGNDAISCIEASDMVVGMFSILLVEALIMGRIAISIQLGLKREDMLITNKLGATVAARSEEALAATFGRALVDSGYRSHLASLAKRYVYIADSMERWTRCLEGLCQ